MTENPLWSGFKLVTALEARVRGVMPTEIHGISIDTRSLREGDLFFAIKGEHSDGHDYVNAAWNAGAAAAVVDEAHSDDIKPNGAMFVVKNVLTSLESLGRVARERSDASIVAVTGSAGKTGTKEMLRIALAGLGEVHASAASYNNHWGVPLTLSRMPESAHCGIFEIGMNHAGEITPLVAMVRPHIAIITTIAPVHLEAFESVDAIADAKAEIFTGLQSNGVAIIHRDVPQFERLHAAAKTSHVVQVLSFGADENADARLVSVTNDADGCLVVARVSGEDVRYRIGAPGRHIAMNSLAVLLAAQALQLDVHEAAASLTQFSAPQGRGARFEIMTPSGPFTLIDESYNANPASMRAALELLGESLPGRNGRRIAVIGDMLELGPLAASLHAELAGDIGARNIDLVYGVGHLTRSLFDQLDVNRCAKWGVTSAGICDAMVEDVRAGDVVMIKGSNGSRMGLLVTALREHYKQNAAVHADAAIIAQD